jgi:hypothetical protein
LAQAGQEEHTTQASILLLEATLFLALLHQLVVETEVLILGLTLMEYRVGLAAVEARLLEVVVVAELEPRDKAMPEVVQAEMRLLAITKQEVVAVGQAQ